jgi:glyoxylase-like metal-dependent hydrolase (beta-lactamase superfamily II)
VVPLDAGLTPDLPDFVSVVPVRTPTLPPATHTNAWVLGRGDLTVFDPASPWDDEQARLAAALKGRIAQGERVERIVLTHHHDDHVGGAEALRKALGDVPVAAHPVTASLVAGRIRVDETIDDDAVLCCGGVELRALFTPGHAPGHLAFVEATTGVTVAGDLVAGIGTILIAPDDGDLGQYLDSLDRLRASGAKVLLPAHGPALHQ